MKIILFIICFGLATAHAQRPPWESPLMIAESNDGITFTNMRVFQDSAGVPCIIRWKGDTLMATFQWFRQPMNGPTWDKVAVKFSYDNGVNWSQPTPIQINNFPSGYQRPFDPTLTVIGGDSLRIYYSSSASMPKNGQDSIINTYSARSKDGIHFDFEPNPRVDLDTNRLIDPAVVRFKNTWHYLSPAGAPQQGAYHYVSPNGLQFSRVPHILSDQTHNWTGNYTVVDTGELRFYGCGPTIWFNSSPNGGQWNGYENTNLHGGDPSVVKRASGDYQIVYVGTPYPQTGLFNKLELANIQLCPQPASTQVWIKGLQEAPVAYRIYNMEGKCIVHEKMEAASIQFQDLKSGVYLLLLEDANDFYIHKKLLVE